MPWVWEVWVAALAVASNLVTIQKEINKLRLYQVEMAILRNYLMACRCPKMPKVKA
ncbi:hypothetical protein D3C81_1249810 [compost metagenome]